ncbi:MAG TPA: hypothetical protein VLR94_10110, partial [Acidobacteriota bacterium]|nr:hypothetical protein [Acidobacteriota bacterium]
MLRSILPAAVTVALLLVLPAGSDSQQTQPKEIHEEVEVDLVDVFLTALDSKGAFVTNLRPEELVLTEDGVPQE